jgi:tRNA threonylcarbamoyladenosine biosynthesis protein TsaB
MNILALETSGEILHLALKTDRTFISHTQTIGRQFSEELVPRLVSLCSEAGLTLADLSLIVCANGPGSFTGLRVGMAAAKGIALAAGIPLVSLGTMDILAYPLSHATLPVLCAVDAKKQRYYCALFKGGKRDSKDMDASIPSIADLVGGYDELLVTGPDAHRLVPLLRDEITKRGGKTIFYIDTLKNRNYGESMIILGKILLEEEGPDDIGSGPTYIRKSDAEVSLEERDANTTPKEV